MQNRNRNIVLGLTLAFVVCGANAQPMTEIKVSYQPALYWSLPYYIASEKNWWAELGLKPTFSTFPAGRHHVHAVGGRAIAHQLGINLGAASLGVFQFFQHQDSAAARNDETVTVQVIGA